MVRLPPADKLPLAARKNRQFVSWLLTSISWLTLPHLVRDEYEAKKEQNETELSKILGETWKIEINPLAIFPYCEEGRKNQLGYILNR